MATPVAPYQEAVEEREQTSTSKLDLAVPCVDRGETHMARTLPCGDATSLEHVGPTPLGGGGVVSGEDTG